MPVASFCAAKSQDGQLLCIKIGRHVMYVGIQWNPDFSNTRLFETTDSSNQKSFPLELFQSNTVILPPIFRMRDFSKLSIFPTNSFFLSKIYIRFLELSKLRNQQKPVLATYYGALSGSKLNEQTCSSLNFETSLFAYNYFLIAALFPV